jgi:hypothetical protein
VQRLLGQFILRQRAPALGQFVHHPLTVFVNRRHIEIDVARRVLEQGNKGFNTTLGSHSAGLPWAFARFTHGIHFGNNR